MILYLKRETESVQSTIHGYQSKPARILELLCEAHCKRKREVESAPKQVFTWSSRRGAMD